MPKSEQKKKIKPSQSGKKSQGENSYGVVTTLIPRSETESQSVKYFQSIGKLRLREFVRCQEEKDLKHLIISGQPTQEELEYAWNDINSQYMDAIGDAEYKHYVSTYKELLKLELTISTIENAIEVLKCFPHSDLFAFLNKSLQTNFKFDYSKKDEYDKNLKRCYQRSRILIVKRDMERAKFEQIKKKFEGTKEADSNYYAKCLISLSDHAGYQVRDKITVFEFCERMRRLNNHYEKLNTAKSNGRR